MENKQETIQETAWNMLQNNTDFKLGERLFIRGAYASTYKEDYPFMCRTHKKGEGEYYHSEIPKISSYRFTNEPEVIIANAIYENTKENFKPNDFINHLKYTLRVIGSDSVWTK